MENDRQMGASSVAELMDEEDHHSGRALVQVAAAALIGIGLLFTGYMNFQLYSRAFPDQLKILGLIPAVLIEGSLATFLVGGFVWFAHGTQGKLAKMFGWLMFCIVALNTIVEFNTLVGAQEVTSNDFLRLYAFWGVPMVLVVTIAFWKAVVDADPSIQIMRQRRKIAQTLQVAKMQAFVTALGSEDSRQALAVFGLRTSEDVNRRLRGELEGGEVIDVPPIVRRNGHKPAEATVVMGAQSSAPQPELAEEEPEEEPEEQPVPKAGWKPPVMDRLGSMKLDPDVMAGRKRHRSERQ
jgi:hypothetical protein